MKDNCSIVVVKDGIPSNVIITTESSAEYVALSEAKSLFLDEDFRSWEDVQNYFLENSVKDEIFICKDVQIVQKSLL